LAAWLSIKKTTGLVAVMKVFGLIQRCCITFHGKKLSVISRVKPLLEIFFNIGAVMRQSILQREEVAMLIFEPSCQLV